MVSILNRGLDINNVDLGKPFLVIPNIGTAVPYNILINTEEYYASSLSSMDFSNDCSNASSNGTHVTTEDKKKDKNKMDLDKETSQENASIRRHNISNQANTNEFI